MYYALEILDQLLDNHVCALETLPFSTSRIFTTIVVVFIVQTDG